MSAKIYESYKSYGNIFQSDAHSCFSYTEKKKKKSVSTSNWLIISFPLMCPVVQ